MGLRPWVAAVISGGVGVGLLALLMPLATRHPYMTDPGMITGFLPQHNYRAPGWSELWITWVGVFALFVGVAPYFWLSGLPGRIRYRSRRR
jgi:hypothetical protein